MCAASAPSASLAPRDIVGLPRPSECINCSWGQKDGKIVLKLIHPFCPAHKDLPRRQEVSWL